MFCWVWMGNVGNRYICITHFITSRNLEPRTKLTEPLSGPVSEVLACLSLRLYTFGMGL